MRIGIIYEITDNPYFSDSPVEFSDKISEFVYPSEINDICKSLEELNYDYEIIDGPQGLLSSIEKKNICNLYFNKSIGFKGLERKIPVPAISLLYNLPIIGSNAYTMTLARHKYHTNRLLKGMGFTVPEAWYISQLEDIPNNICFPVILKPNEESDSLGISENSVYTSMAGMKEHIEYLLTTFKQPVIIEEIIEGEEWKMSVIGNGKNAHTYGGVNSLKKGKIMIGTLQTREDILENNLSYKDLDRNERYVEAKLIAESIHSNLGLNDYSRCDFRLKDDKLYCMEVSTHPFLSNSDRYSSFVKAAKQELICYNNVIKAIIQVSCERNKLYATV